MFSNQIPVSSSQFKSILDGALTEYKKITGNDLLDNWLAKELQSCDSAEAILDIIQSHAEAFDKFRNGDNKLMKWVRSSVHVLYTISSTLGEGVGIALPPAKAVFVGIGVLLAAAKDVQSSHDALVDLFERIQFFLKRLGVHTQISLTKDMVEILMKIVAEVLSILSIATKEMQQSRTKTYLKKLVGRTDIEDALKRLDSLTREEFQMAMVEVRMALAQVLKSTSEHKYDAKKAYGTVQEIARNVDEMMYTVGKIKYNVDEIMWIHIEQDIRKWFFSPDPTVNYNTACEAYHEGTATWFFEGTIFKEWDLIGSLLWVHGKPGSGKSILCTSIIKHLISLRDDGLATLAFFYFDFRDKEKQNVRNFLTSLLTQFSAYSEPCCGIISRLYFTHAKGAQQPSVGALKNCLKEMLRVVAQQPVYVILDALDECPDVSGMPTPRETVLGLLEDLVEMQLPSLHLCVTSRPEVDIKDALEPLAYCVVSLHDESGQQKDISDYVGDVVYSDKKMRNWRAGEKGLVIEELSKKADGMFRWVFCQLEVLRYCLPASIRQTLDQLPKTLDETYARVLSQIPQANQAHAHRMLQCLMVAVRPLQVEELAELLAFEFDTAQGAVPKYRADWTPHDKVHAVLSTCSSLISIVEDQGFQVVQFSHFSVKEFLMSNRLGDFSQYQINPGPAHTILAQACLGSLLHLDDHANKEIVKSFPLAEYAAKHWVMHAQFDDVAPLVKDGMVSLFDCDKPHFATWVGIYNIDESPSKIPTPLYYSSLCGFSDLVEHLAIKHPQHVNAIGGLYEFPLLAALIKDHVRAAEILLKHGANVNARGTGECTPLHGAITDVSVVQFLLKYGADVNCRADDLLTPLHLAVENDELEVARVLLEHGADVDSRDEEGKTLLCRLLSGDIDRDIDGDEDGDGDSDIDSNIDSDSDSGCDSDEDSDNDGDNGHSILRLLLEHGADTNIRILKGWTPLHMTAFSGALNFARMFLDHGAATNAENEQGETPLHLVSRGGRESRRHVGISRLLLERGADVNAQRRSMATPLHLAAFRGRLKITEALLDHGANPNVKNDQGETSLHVVSRGKRDSQEHVSITRLLLERGADVNARRKSKATPLHLAVLKGRPEIAQMLLDRGANPGAEDDQGETPLHLVSRGECDSEFQEDGIGIALLLVEHGVDVNTRSMSEATPLHLAAFKGRSGIAQVLLSCGANPGAEDDQGETPLHLVSRGDFKSREDGINIALLLLEHGVDVNARRKSRATPLHLAAFKGRSDVAQVLLDHGANPGVENNQGETPLHLVSRGEYDSQEDGIVIALLLLGHGVDVNARDKNKTTPLHSAAFRGRLEIAQVLLDHDANLDVENDQGENPLHLVSRGDYDSQEDGVVIALLLLGGRGADVHARDKHHDTALHSAAFWGRLGIATALLDHGANPNVENDQGETPLHLVSRGECNPREHGVDIAQLLFESGVDVNAPDKDQNTPLHSASHLGRLEIVRVLLDHGADASSENDQAQTPLHLVSQGGYWLQDDGLGVAELLLERGADINAQDKDHATPLHVACYRGRLDIARVLLDYDAKS